MTASVPCTSSSRKAIGASKLNVAAAIGPKANSSRAESWVSTVTSNVSPARGPLPMVRLCWARLLKARDGPDSSMPPRTEAFIEAFANTYQEETSEL